MSDMLAVMKSYTDAWRSGDRVALAACYHDEFTLHYAGNNPLSGTHVGKPVALKILAEVSRRSNRKLEAIIDVMAGEQRATVIVRERFQRGEDVAVLERVLVYTIRDDKLHECWVYDQDQALVDHFLA